jgi:hypothetical protein
MPNLFSLSSSSPLHWQQFFCFFKKIARNIACMNSFAYTLFVRNNVRIRIRLAYGCSVNTSLYTVSGVTRSPLFFPIMEPCAPTLPALVAFEQTEGVEIESGLCGHAGEGFSAKDRI